MKQARRIPALLLAAFLVCSLTLTGCGQETPAPADQVAVALFDMILKDDASSLVELLGYASVAEARADMGLEGGLYDGLAEQMAAQFTEGGMTVSSEEMQEFVDAFIKMFSGVKMTAVTKQSDEKEGAAVVTCTVNTFDPAAVSQAMADATSTLDPALLQSGSVESAFGAILKAAAGAIADVKPTENTADFDVDFELADMDVNGKTKKVWVPKNAAEFGNLLTITAMGG